MSRSIEVENLTFRYYVKEVLHAISFSVGEGEVVGMLGPNGAGKSTTIKILTGLLSSGEGRVRVGGCRMPEESVGAKRLLGYVPESALLYESLTAQEYLELTGRLREIEERALQVKITTLLEILEVDKARFQRLATFSKGMRQKVLIAAALLHNPSILLLDEPLTGLDVRSSLIVKDLIQALAREGKTVLYSSHVLDVVERVCHRILIIHEGRLIADGALATLKDRTRSSTLEEVFRQLTHTESSAPAIGRALEAMKL